MKQSNTKFINSNYKPQISILKNNQESKERVKREKMAFEAHFPFMVDFDVDFEEDDVRDHHSDIGTQRLFSSNTSSNLYHLV